MTPEQQDAVTAACNALDFVRWDRMTSGDEHDGWAHVFGWIDRVDGRSDFVLLEFYNVWGWGLADCSSMTSSARYSEEIQLRLRGNAEGHVSCQRVEDVLPGVTLAIRQSVAPAAPLKSGTGR